MIAAVMMGILSDRLIMMGVSSIWRAGIMGFVILADVVIEQAQGRLQACAALTEAAAPQADAWMRI